MEKVSNIEELNKQLTGSEKVVVDFWAEWCGPCKASMPAYEKASEENPQISFLKANVDEAKQLVEEYGIRSVPTFIYFENGKEVKRKTGAFRNIAEIVD